MANQKLKSLLQITTLHLSYTSFLRRTHFNQSCLQIEALLDRLNDNTFNKRFGKIQSYETKVLLFLIFLFGLSDTQGNSGLDVLSRALASLPTQSDFVAFFN